MTPTFLKSALIFFLISLLYWFRLPTKQVSRWLRLPGRGILRRVFEMLLLVLTLGLYGLKLLVTPISGFIWYILLMAAWVKFTDHQLLSFVILLIPGLSFWFIGSHQVEQGPYRRFSKGIRRPVMPWSPRPKIERDVQIPTEYDQPLLCDIYQPKKAKSRSGITIIHLHATAWQGMDKGQLTRHLFQRLTLQGHTIIDVAYTLAPTAMMKQMVREVKYAISWVKEQAEELQVDPEKVVLMGESGGGHLALQCAYSPNDPKFQHESITIDTSVYAVIAIHAPTDLAVAFQEYGTMEPRQPDFSNQITPDMQPRVFNQTAIDRLITKWRLLPEYRYQNMPGGPLLITYLMGGTLNELPVYYALYSPIMFVTPDCPPTLYLTGEQDFFYRATYGRALHAELVNKGVPSVYAAMKMADHGFLLFFPRISCPARKGMISIAQFLSDLEHPRTINANAMPWEPREL